VGAHQPYRPAQRVPLPRGRPAGTQPVEPGEGRRTAGSDHFQLISAVVRPSRATSRGSSTWVELGRSLGTVCRTQTRLGEWRGRGSLLEEQLKSELIVFRRREPAIHQVVEADEVSAGMGTQGGPDNGPGEPADDRAKDKWPDTRGSWAARASSVWIGRRIGNLVDVFQHLLILPKPWRRSPSTHWMARRVGASAHKSSRR
jgi:hypothetical protein